MSGTQPGTHGEVVRSESGKGNVVLSFVRSPGLRLMAWSGMTPSPSPPCPSGRADGLTDDEGAVIDALSDAVEAFGALPCQHPSDEAEFLAGIHRLQDLIGIRVARRLYPDGWVNLEVHPEDAA